MRIDPKAATSSSRSLIVVLHYFIQREQEGKKLFSRENDEEKKLREKIVKRFLVGFVKKMIWKRVPLKTSFTGTIAL